jgi:hypothetical protein
MTRASGSSSLGSRPPGGSSQATRYARSRVNQPCAISAPKPNQQRQLGSGDQAPDADSLAFAFRSRTQHPTSEWIVQQLREAFPASTDNQYLIFDRDAKFGAAYSISWNPVEFLLCGRATGALAKRSCRTLGSKLPQRTTRSCDRARRKPPPPFGSRLPALLPSRSYSRWA